MTCTSLDYTAFQALTFFLFLTSSGPNEPLPTAHQHAPHTPVSACGQDVLLPLMWSSPQGGGGQTDMERDRQTDRQTWRERQRQRETETETDIQTWRQTDRQRHTHTDRHGETERDGDKETYDHERERHDAFIPLRVRMIGPEIGGGRVKGGGGVGVEQKTNCILACRILQSTFSLSVHFSSRWYVRAREAHMRSIPPLGKFSRCRH